MMRTFIVIIYFMLFALSGYSQNKSENKLKTNAKDTLTISEMFSTGDGVGEGVRKYKIVGRKYVYRTYAVDVMPKFLDSVYDFNDIVSRKVKALYPETQKTFKIEFVIDYDGRPTNFRFWWSKHSDIDKKLIKFIKSLGKWSPGIKGDKYVKVKMDFQY